MSWSFQKQMVISLCEFWTWRLKVKTHWRSFHACQNIFSNEWHLDQARFTRKRSLIFECLFNDCTFSMIIPLCFYNIWTLTSSCVWFRPPLFHMKTLFLMCPPPPYFSFHLTFPCPLTSFAMTPPFFLDRTFGHFNAIEVLMKHVSNFFQRLNSNANVSSLGQSKYHHNPISEERLDIKEFLLCTWCYLTWDHAKSSKHLRFVLIT